ncbi:MAG: V-type ATP synthase subunit E [Sphaerochaetaceae bacterium]|nr:V-type ATP synthase subunit E [Sphaerochaetaceae bacterium]
MEIQIQDLVQSIKRDGIEEAKKEAEAIVNAAKAEASKIVESSKVEAQKNLESAQREIESSKALIKQAERDAVLCVKKELQNVLSGILASKIGTELTGENLAKLIQAAISGQNPSDFTVEIESANKALKSALASEIEKGLEIKPVKGMSGKMKLVCKDGSGFIDFSDEEIAALLKPFLGEIKV